MNETKFSVNDYSGTTVSCSNARWDNHIAAGHEIMEGNVKAVKDTIKDPDTVYNSNQNQSRKVFFKMSQYSTYKMNTKVIVEYAPGKKNPERTVGEVVTAFPQKHEKGGVADVIYKRTTED